MSTQVIHKVTHVHPLRFQPIIKQRRWGGRRLGQVLRKTIGNDSDYAESWELVDHGDDQSIVQSTCDLDGLTLQQLTRDHPEKIFGEGVVLVQFPLLFKFLDANDRLSVQVHPNDEQAKRFDPTENGKTEAWYIIDAEPDSVIYTGLKSDIGRREFEQAIAIGDFENCLHSVHPKPGECYFIPAGTVHALGEGVLIAEVQQSSDLTFRIFDWNWVDQHDRPRELHVEQALSCIEFGSPPVVASLSTPLFEGDTHSTRLHVSCDYFRLLSHHIPGPSTIDVDGICRVWMCLSGQGSLMIESTELNIQKGETLLIPASCPDIQIEPDLDGEELVILETLDFC